MNSQESTINTQELTTNSQESLESVVLMTQTFESSTNSLFFKSADSSLSVLEDVMSVEEYATSPLEKKLSEILLHLHQNQVSAKAMMGILPQVCLM